MDIFDGPYYRINKFLLTCLGQWPYQSSSHKRFIRIFVLVVGVSITVPEILRLIDVWGELDYVIECASVFGVQISIGMKYYNYVVNADKIKMLMDRMKIDWKINEFVGYYLNYTGDFALSPPNKTHLLLLIFLSFDLSPGRTVYMYSTLATYVAMPMMPKFLDLVVPLNESRTVEFPLPTKYGDLDPDRYYLPMIVHADIVVIFTITTIVAMDSTYAVLVQHACGLFAVLGDKLERSMELNSDEALDDLDPKRHEEMTYRAVSNCVKMHNDVIEFTNVIESSHTVLFFFVIGLTVFCMSVAGYQMIMNLENPNEAFRFAAFTIAQVAHIFFISWPGQKLIDHSERIHEWAYGARWYQASPRSRKLLLLMMLRSKEPCKLTAGKLYIMSLANFSMVVRTSVSYFTVLTSFR